MSQQDVIRTYVRSAYDIQSLRISMGNRMVGNWKHKLGQLPGMSEEELEARSKKVIDDLRASYTRLADAMPRQVAKFEGDALITDYAEYALVDQYFTLLRDEEHHFKKLDKILVGIPIFDEFLSKVKGIGPAMAGVIISEIDIHRAHYPSSLSAYAGLDVTPVWHKVEGPGPEFIGDQTLLHIENVVFNHEHTEATIPSGALYTMETQGRSRKSHHLVEREYQPKGWSEGDPLALKKSITFNPFLKTKLIGVAGGSFLKASRVLINGENMSTVRRQELAKSFGWNEYQVPVQGSAKKVKKDSETSRQEVLDCLRANGFTVVFDSSPYQLAYTQYKARISSDPRHKDKTDMHRHNMAVRYMVKRFLADLYVKWRTLEGLPVAPTYEEAKLGMIHGSGTNHLRAA